MYNMYLAHSYSIRLSIFFIKLKQLVKFLQEPFILEMIHFNCDIFENCVPQLLLLF